MNQDQVRAVLEDFGKWLSNLPAGAPPAPVAAQSVDLHTLLGQFVALRHEVNLQTKATRAQQEQNSQTLEQLSEALDDLQRERDQAERTRTASVEDSQRPLVKTLIDLHDALSLANREVTRAQTSIQPLLQKVNAALDLSDVGTWTDKQLPAVPENASPSWLARLFGAKGFDARPLLEELGQVRQERQHDLRKYQARREQAAIAAESVNLSLTAVVTGYTMSLQRIERALRQHGLEPIPALGEPFDPERMEALEALTGTGKNAGEVIDEVRRGYLWNGRVFRFAQVRVARGG